MKLICTNDKVQIDLCQVNENFLRNISSFCVVWMINMNSSIQWHAAHSVSLNESSLILDSKSSHYMNPKCCNLMADENKHMHINLCKLKAIFDADWEKSHSDACLIYSHWSKINLYWAQMDWLECLHEGFQSDRDINLIIWMHVSVAYCASNLTCYLYRGLFFFFLINLNDSF